MASELNIEETALAVGSLLGRLVAAGRLPSKVAASLMDKLAPPDANLMALYGAYRRQEIDADDLLVGFASLSLTSVPDPAESLSSLLESIIHENDFSSTEEAALVDAVMKADPELFSAITLYQGRLRSGISSGNARRELASNLVRLARLRAREIKAASAPPPTFPVSALVNLAELLRQNNVIDTHVALGLLDAIQAEDSDLRSAYAAYVGGKLTFRQLAVVAASVGSRFAGEDVLTDTVAPSTKAVQPPPPPPGRSNYGASVARSEPRLDQSEELASFHADLVSSLREKGAISGDDATTLRHLFIAADPRIALAYQNFAATGDVESTIRAILRIVAAEHAADAASPEYIAEAVGSLGSRGLISADDGELLLRYIAGGARRDDPVLESLTRSLVDFQADGDIEQLVTDVEDLAAAGHRLGASNDTIARSTAAQAALAAVMQNQRQSTVSGSAISSSVADADTHRTSKARLDSLHERRALLATISQLVAMRSMLPTVAGALTRLIHTEDPVTLAAFRLFVQNEDVDEFIDTLTRVGTAALARSSSELGGVVANNADDASDWGGEIAPTKQGTGGTGLLSRDQRDMLLRCAQTLRDILHTVSPQEAAALMRAILAAQSGQFSKEEDLAAPALLSIAEVYSSSGNLERMLESLTRVARLLAEGDDE